MTDENRRLRDKISKIESMALTCLANQPSGDDECKRHLLKALSKIAEEADGYQGMVEVEAYDIDWCTDGTNVNLPKTFRVMMHPWNVEDNLANELSDRWGWLVNTCNYRII